MKQAKPEARWHGDGCLCLRCRQAWGAHQMKLHTARNAVVEAAKLWEAYWRDAMDKSTWPAENTDLSNAVSKLEALKGGGQ